MYFAFILIHQNDEINQSVLSGIAGLMEWFKNNNNDSGIRRGFVMF